jgi:hypothetical protein
VLLWKEKMANGFINFNLEVTQPYPDIPLAVTSHMATANFKVQGRAVLHMFGRWRARNIW